MVSYSDGNVPRADGSFSGVLKSPTFSVNRFDAWQLGREERKTHERDRQQAAMFSYVAPDKSRPEASSGASDPANGGGATGRLGGELRRVVLAYRIAVDSAHIPVAGFVVGALMLAAGAYRVFREFRAMARSGDPNAIPLPDARETPLPPNEGEFRVAPEEFERALAELEANSDRIGFRAPPRDAIAVARERLPGGRLGETHCNLFGCSRIVLSLVTRDRAELVGTIWHQARHFHASLRERLIVFPWEHERLEFWTIDVENAFRTGNLPRFSVPLRNGQVDLSVPYREIFIP